MSWPNPNEYLEAIQYPRQAFSDPELRDARVKTNRFGLPRPISGNFATVFEVETRRGNCAVRCFMREVTNQQERYAAIASHLKQHPLPFMVYFDYLPQGINVHGKWYPILKMDWADGMRLDTYIELNLSAPDRLRRLGERWMALCRMLRQASIAHGDLQHGNILVTQDETIKLIDYDDMIVPGAIHLANDEIGHRHYQHPTRAAPSAITLDNLSRIDNFSSHVIGLSIFALSLDPTLWLKTGAGDENLLFRDADYAAPDRSQTLQLLSKHANANVRHAGQMMLAAVNASSYLEVAPFSRSPLETPAARAKSWLASRVLESIDSSAPPAPATMPKPAARADSWVFDHLDQPPPAPPDFSEEFLAQERRTIDAEFQQSMFKSLRPLSIFYLIFQIVRRFPTYPPVIEKQQHEEAIRALENQLSAATARRKTLSRLIVEADQRYQQALYAHELNIAQLSGDLQYSLKKEARELAQIERILHEQTDKLPYLPSSSEETASIEETQLRMLPWDSTELTSQTVEVDETQVAYTTHDTPSHNGTDTLSRWTHLMEQHAALHTAFPVSLGDIRAARERYHVAQRTLEAQQKDEEDRLEALKTSSDSLTLAQRLRAELHENEQELADVKRQHARISDELRLYVHISRRRLLWKLLRKSLIEVLQASV